METISVVYFRRPIPQSIKMAVSVNSKKVCFCTISMLLPCPCLHGREWSIVLYYIFISFFFVDVSTTDASILFVLLKIKHTYYPRWTIRQTTLFLPALSCKANSRLTLDWLSNGQVGDFLPHCLHPLDVYLYFENVCQTDGTIATGMRWKGGTVFLCRWVML